LTKPPKTYSGLNVRQMAEAYGLSDYYFKLYRSQSTTTHGADATLNVKLNTATITLVDTTGFDTALTTAAMLICFFVSDLNKAFKLGLEAELDQIRSAYAAEMHRTRAERRARKK
jgi:hypothetical protein